MLKGMIVALITPFKKNGDIDFVSLKKLCNFHLSSGTDGLVVLGTTGEVPTILEKEQDQIVDTVLCEINGKIPVIVGAGTNNTYESVQRSIKYKKMGVDASLAIVPYYNRPTPKGCVQHFKAIVQSALPTIMYYHPGRTGVKLSVETINEILDLEGIIGIKDCSCDETILGGLKKQNLFCGNDKDMLKMLSFGAVGSISVVGNIIPSVWKKIVCERNEELFFQIQKLVEAIDLEVNPQPIKYAASLMGLSSDVVRLPMVECEEVTKKVIEEAIVFLLKKETQYHLKKTQPVLDSVQPT